MTTIIMINDTFKYATRRFFLLPTSDLDDVPVVEGKKAEENDDKNSSEWFVHAGEKKTILNGMKLVQIGEKERRMGEIKIGVILCHWK